MNFEQQNHAVNPAVTSQYHQLFDHGEVPNMTSFMLHGADHQRSFYHPYDQLSSRGNPQQMFFAGNPHVGTGDAPYYIAPPHAATLGGLEHHGGGFGGGKFPNMGGSNMRVMHEIEEISEEEKERQRVKREKNRIAAAKCRNRRREQLESLEKETEMLERENKSKRELLRVLKEEKDNLQRALQFHESKCTLKASS